MASVGRSGDVNIVNTVVREAGRPLIQYLYRIGYDRVLAYNVSDPSTCPDDHPNSPVFRRFGVHVAPRLGMVRVEVYHQSTPGKRALLSLEEDATLDDLHKAIEARLRIKPETICLGETQAQIVSIYDIRDGDAIRVVSPALPGDDADVPAGPVVGDGEEVYDGPSPWRRLLKVILTLAIFVFLQFGVQNFIYFPLFREDFADDDGDESKWSEGSHHYVDPSQMR